MTCIYKGSKRLKKLVNPVAEQFSDIVSLSKEGFTTPILDSEQQSDLRLLEATTMSGGPYNTIVSLPESTQISGIDAANSLYKYMDLFTDTIVREDTSLEQQWLDSLNSVRTSESFCSIPNEKNMVAYQKMAHFCVSISLQYILRAHYMSMYSIFIWAD
jgi:hypothetical protein